MRKICRFSFEREYRLVVIWVVVPQNAVSFRKSPTPFRNQQVDMTETDRFKYFRVALLLVGVIVVVGIYSLTIIWPSAGRAAH
jgi:hypothetical protein